MYGLIGNLLNKGLASVMCMFYSAHIDCSREGIRSSRNVQLGEVVNFLGLNFNQVQVFIMLLLMAKITNKQPKVAYHSIINAHIYEDQLTLMRDVQLKREPFPHPKIIINPDIKTLEDVETWVTPNDFILEGYQHHDPIQYPFSV